MVKELLTRDDYFAAVSGGEGVIVIVDTPKRTRTAHPLSCPTLDATRFVEKVVVNERALDAQPCYCT